MKKLLILTILFFANLVFAGTSLMPDTFNKGIIKGTIVDSTDGSPLNYANILLYRVKDSSYINGISSGITGEFILTDVTEGEYYLKVSYIGYENKFVNNIKVEQSKVSFDAGMIKLSRNAFELDETRVVGEKVNEELHLDKKVINVSQDLNAAGNTALEVLQNQPSVRVDPDGTVYLRGSSSFTILINGRPSVLQGSDALKQIPANSIENIELITNPSAKYDAEGTSGIININLKKTKEYTLSGIVNMNGGTRDKYNIDASANYNIDGLNLSGGVDYRDNANFNNQAIDRTTYLNSGNINNNTELAIRDKRQQYSGRVGVDYTFDDFNSLSLNSSAGKVGLLRSLNAEITNETPASILYAENVNTMDIPVKYFNSSFNFLHKFNPDKNDIALEATYSNVSLPSVQETNEYSVDALFQNRNTNPLNTVFINDAERNEGRVKLNYSHKLNSTTSFEAGTQTNYSYRNFNIENKKYDYSIPGYVVDVGLTNKFKFRNNVHAAYISFTSALYDFNFMFGLRGEYMDRLLEQQTLGGNYGYKKMDYFPSINISRKIEEHQLQFSYSRRVNRPNENLLNPFPFYSDSYLSSAGNPKLLPEYINSYELNYQKMFGSIYFSVQSYFRNSNNTAQQYFYVDQAGKLYTTFGNFGKTDTYGSEISSSFSIAQILRFDPAVNLYGNKLSGTVAGQKVNKEFFNWNCRLNTTLTLTPDTRLQVSGNYFAKFIDAQSESKPFCMLTASLRQDFFNKQFSVTLQARNILNTSNFNISNSGKNYRTHILVKQEIPVVSLMLSYNFNNFKRTNRQGDNIDIGTGM